jgi:uncharacterized phage protein (TIGR01671 family)
MLQPKIYVKDKKKVYDTQYIDYKHKRVIFFDSETQWTYTRLFSEVEFMENTGFKDMNGNDIFVGDIIKHHNSCLRDRGKNFLIEKHDFDKRYTFSNLDEYYYDLDEEEAELVEVIGNIYEDKELLEIDKTNQKVDI